MTRSSSQQTPASASPEARAESGAESERAAASSTENAALVGPVAPDAPDSAPVHAKSEAAEAEPSATGKPSKAEKPSEAGKGEKAGKPEGGERPEARAPDGGAATPGAAAPDSETDPSASAAAQSRLPALVRTMTATAIGQPQQEAGPVGRPGRAALAGAAVVGAVLVSVPFLVLAGNNDEGPKQTNAAAAGTVLDGSGPEAPGEFAVTAPETSAPAEDGKGKKDETKPEKAGNPVPVVPSADGGKEEPKKGDGSKDTAEKADSSQEQPEKESGGGKNQPAKAQPAVTFSGPVSFRSHLSGRCLDVPGHNFNDGQPLFMWDCNGADAQKWRFGSDGTIRARDKCLDVANANFNNGSRIQLAWCNGADAQKFTLNGAHDLVNTAVGKCVDIPNHSKGRGPETYLILFDCTGNDNQKWST
ncbi:ricin-type beta-trefoil lectin domain protein [Streptomyces sp. wa1002]|uniref:ricin-type beta-trefoil lectin domain protein n=2 Tax=unclassified Streptomyces TaxID=2593676 RepID=UPI000BF186CC|nr:ricin-type beta-trefoil lectin domain protein [Streptomyces sp. wa1002]